MPHQLFIIMFITERLLALADIPYRDFTAKLIPTIDKKRIIGVRTPAMRSLAKELLKQQPKGGYGFLGKIASLLLRRK